jgi:nucleotide-binding universal stress UspA family protein
MFTNLSDIIKIPLAVLAGLSLGVLVYEGIKLPWIGQVVPGIVWYRVDAVKANMVTTLERDVLRAQLDQERRYRETAEAASARAQERAAATEIARQNAEARIDELQAQAKKEGMDGWSKDELDWLQRH